MKGHEDNAQVEAGSIHSALLSMPAEALTMTIIVQGVTGVSEGQDI